jgi:regulatory protein
MDTQSQRDIITALQPDPRDPDRVHVHIDGRHAIAVTIEVAAAERLTVGQPCPPDRLARLHDAQEMSNIVSGALNFLSYRPRSAREVEMRLRKKGHAPEQIEVVMARLRKLGYVDDEGFARFWVGNRQTFSPRGPRLLRSELRQKGVPSDIVEKVLAEREEEQEQEPLFSSNIDEVAEEDEDDAPPPGSDLANAVALARKRARSLSGLDPQVAKRRLFAFLTRRGYDYGTVGEALRRVLAEDDDEMVED